MIVPSHMMIGLIRPTVFFFWILPDSYQSIWIWIWLVACLNCVCVCVCAVDTPLLHSECIRKNFHFSFGGEKKNVENIFFSPIFFPKNVYQTIATWPETKMMMMTVVCVSPYDNCSLIIITFPPLSVLVLTSWHDLCSPK